MMQFKERRRKEKFNFMTQRAYLNVMLLIFAIENMKTPNKEKIERETEIKNKFTL